MKSIRFCPKIWINLKNSNRIQIVSFVRELLLRQRKIKKENYHVEGENLTWKNKRRRRKITEIEIAVANYKSNSGKWSLRSILQYSKPTLTSCKSVDWLNFRTVKSLKTTAIYWWTSLPIMTIWVNSWGEIYRLLEFLIAVSKSGFVAKLI